MTRPAVLSGTRSSDALMNFFIRESPTAKSFFARLWCAARALSREIFRGQDLDARVADGQRTPHAVAQRAQHAAGRRDGVLHVLVQDVAQRAGKKHRAV